VLAWHALVGWWLLHALPRISMRNGDADALQVVYVTLPPWSTPSPRTRAGMPSRRDQHAKRTRKSRQQAPATATATTGTLQVVTETPPDLFAQARTQARERAAATAPATDAFADRPARLPQADAGRFRMRDPLTPARVVAWLGSHTLAPRGYERDPCPRNRRNIDGLLAAGDSPRLQLELEFEREHCRP
jgi:hypothetical protein